MTYRELIELYKNGKLDDTQKEKVEKDIERQEAISEYLFDRDDLAGVTNMPEDEVDPMNISEEIGDESEKFMKMIRASIRKTFIKVGVVVGAVVLAVVCFIIFALPQIEDQLYYDPSEIMGETEYGRETNRMSLDLAVYSELFLPEAYREKVEVNGNGNGKYDIVIMQNVSYTGEFTNVGGTINKGELLLYDPNLFKRPVGNSFIPAEGVVEDYFVAGDIGGSSEDIQELDDKEYYSAYITLDEVMNYTEFTKWASSYDLYPDWCAICEKDDNYNPNEDTAEYIADEIVGFIYTTSCRELVYDTDKYPLLSQYDLGKTTSEEKDWITSEENMKQHVISLLRFMADETEFCEMMDMDEESIEKINTMADNVEEHGLNIYGFMIVVQKDELEEISKLDGVHFIYTEPIK